MEWQGRQALKVFVGDWFPVAVSGDQGCLEPVVLVVPAVSVGPEWSVVPVGVVQQGLAGLKRSGVGRPSRCNWLVRLSVGPQVGNLSA